MRRINKQLLQRQEKSSRITELILENPKSPNLTVNRIEALKTLTELLLYKVESPGRNILG